MDALSDVLRIVQLSGAVYLSGEFTAPWCLISQADSAICASFLPPSERIVSYHFIVEGCCRAQLAGDEQSAIQLEAGDVLVIPQGDAHLLGSDLGLKPAPSAPLIAEHLETH